MAKKKRKLEPIEEKSYVMVIWVLIMQEVELSIRLQQLKYFKLFLTIVGYFILGYFHKF